MEKIEMCLECEPFHANIDVDAMEETLVVVNEQFKEFRHMVQDRDSELEGISLELALGLSEAFEGLKRISSGDPSVRIPETSKLELMTKLKHMVNQTAKDLGEIVHLSHEFAIGLAEHFDTLHRVSEGDLSARVAGTSQVEILESLKAMTNEMIESVSKEIAERKRAEEAFRKSEGELSTIFDSVRDGIVVLDRAGKILKVNRSVVDAGGYEESDLIGKSFGELTFFPPQSLSLMETAFDLLIQGMRTPPLEVEFRDNSGSLVYLDITGNPFIEKGQLVGIVVILRNVTRRVLAREDKKRIESQLRAAQKLEAIGTLAGGIAHDFNNLLMAIQGNVSLMLMNQAPLDGSRKRLKNIERQIESGAKLTSLLLGYARKGRYEVKSIDLNQLVEEVSETFFTAKKNVKVHQELDSTLPPIAVDTAQIEHVLLNLFVNAADAMPGGGNLVLSTMTVTHEDMTGKLYIPDPGKYVMLKVTDTGTGMNQETTERIFEPFFTTKDMGRGTGLGLASVFGIVKGHGGYIDVDSQRGHGTTFSIYLPALEKKIEEGAQPSFATMEGTETVLLADDEEDVREVSKELLESVGYRVLTAKDGKEALEIYRRNRDGIDIVVLDMVMPNMSGREAYDRMKEINPDVKILLSSGYSIESKATAALKRRCDGFVQKPFRLHELSGELRNILD
ncbi:MAG: response regulator, partial [Deltaproteobacteria bacterium]|nr:response regulator [Deltaproteobacteria bacterium]